MIQKSLFTFLLLGTGFIAQAKTITALINTRKDAIKISLDNIKLGNFKLGMDTIRTGNDTVLTGSDTLKIGSILIVNKKEAEAPAAAPAPTNEEILSALNEIINENQTK